MARNRRLRRRSNRNFVAIPFTAAVALGTLGSGGVISGDLLGSALGEDLYILSIDGQWAVRSITAGEGPLQVGFAHDDLSTTEIGEYLTAELTDPDDII